MSLKRLLILLAACLASVQAAPCRAEDAIRTNAADIVIKADTMSNDQQDGTIRASGSVNMLWEGISLRANRATYQPGTKILNAEGYVIIRKGDDILTGEKVTLNLETGRGELENASVSVQQTNATITGKKVIRKDDNTLVISGTQVTTCELPDPSWKISAEELEVNLLGYAIGRNVVFYIRKIPVFYTPWIAFPVVRERRTGLLFPRFGYSNRRGAQVDIPFYWNISPSQDALFDLDIETRRGAGTGVEYRYIRSRGSEGNINGFLIYDVMDGRWRGQIGQNHKEIISPDLNLRSTVNLTSDRRFLSDFGEKSGEYNRQTNDTIFNALKTWQNYALTTHLRYSEDYYAVDNSRTLQTLPEIGFTAVRQQIFSLPAYIDFDATATNFQRDVGPSGQRLQAFPRLTLVGGIPGYLNASINGGVHLRGYNTQSSPAGASYRREEGSALPEAGATLATSFSRVYEVNGSNLIKLRHEVTPELSYRFSPEQDQSRLPFYDYNDRLIHQNVLYYGFSSYLGGKFKSGDSYEYRDLSRIRLMQGYSLKGSRRDLLTLVDDGHHLTDLILESDTWLHPLAKLTFDARYNLIDNRFSTVAPGLEIDDKQGNTLAATYRMARNELEYLEGRLSTKMFTPWTLGFTTRYSFDRGGFLESVYSAEYRHQCWSVVMALHDRVGSQSFTVNFNLAGLTDSGFSK